MTRRILLLVALTAALAVPAVALAGGSGDNPAAGAKGARAGKVLDRVSARLDKRYQAFSGRCLVANAPEKCAKAARRFVKHLDVLQRVLHKTEDAIKTRCASATPPARCTSAAEVTQKIDDLLAKIATDEAAIKTAFPATASA